MDSTLTLRRDHDLLRKKLALLESALQVAPEARVIFREMCTSLQRLLQEHMHREASALQLYYHRVPSGRYLLEAGDHAIEQRLLRSVNELLLGGMKASMPMVVLKLSQAIEQLQVTMERQERIMFASLDLVRAWELDETSMDISSTMSINEVLQRYPQTERIFDQLQVHRHRDGSDSLDELAWRRGMDVAQLIEQLRHTVTASPSIMQ